VIPAPQRNWIQAQGCLRLPKQPQFSPGRTLDADSRVQSAAQALGYDPEVSPEDIRRAQALSQAKQSLVTTRSNRADCYARANDVETLA